MQKQAYDSQLGFFFFLILKYPLAPSHVVVTLHLYFSKWINASKKTFETNSRKVNALMYKAKK